VANLAKLKSGVGEARGLKGGSDCPESLDNQIDLSISHSGKILKEDAFQGYRLDITL